MELILASASPRRFEILSMLDYEFEVFIPEFDERKCEEDLRKNGMFDIKVLTSLVARAKAEAGYKQFKQKNPNKNILVIAADTIVVLDEEIFGKGENKNKSIEMLKKLSGKTHEVVTAIEIIGDDNIHKSGLEISEVKFAMLKDEMIEKYVDKEKPYDKAGAYAIQGRASIFIEKITGNYYNIMGLPIRLLYTMLEEFKIRQIEL